MHWPHCRKQEDDGHEGRPDDSPRIDKDTRLAHVPGTRLKLVKSQFADDGDAVGPVQGDGTDIEDGVDGDGAAEADEVDDDAEYGVEPHSKHWCVGPPPDSVPRTSSSELYSVSRHRVIIREYQ